MFKKIGEFFRGIKTDIKEKGIRRSPWLYLVCFLAVIIPALFAVYFAYFYEETSFLSSNDIAVSLYDAEGTLMHKEEIAAADLQSSPFVETFYNIDAEKTAVTFSEAFNRAPNFKFTFDTKNSFTEYSCYFNESYSNSFIFGGGSYYALSESSYTAFLNSDFSQAAYKSAIPATLTTDNGDFILPTDAEWYYKKQNNSAAKATEISLAESTDSEYKMSGAVHLSFNIPPDSCVAQIYDNNGTLLFNGDYMRLSELPLEVGQSVSAKISATWTQSTEKAFWGNISYSFKILLGSQAEFSVDSTAVSTGGFLTVTVKNVDDPSKIIYTANADDDESLFKALDTESTDNEKNAVNSLYNFIPEFLLSDGVARAFLPFSNELPNGKFSFSLSCGSAIGDFTIDVSQKSVSVYDSFNKPAQTVSTEKAELFYAAVIKLSAAEQEFTPQKPLFTDSFASPADFGYKKGYTFGNSVLTSDKLSAFMARGDEYLSTILGGQSVYALNTGVVLRASYDEHLGNYAVVDHGMGVRTWYCHLSDLSVSAGSIVKKGEQVGKSGNGPMLSSDGFLLLVTIKNVLSDPQCVYGKALIPKVQNSES